MNNNDIDTIRRAIAMIKAYIEKNSLEQKEADAVAKHWWENDDHNGHSNWEVLATDVKTSWSMIAQMALREIETGEPTPEK